MLTWYCVRIAVLRDPQTITVPLPDRQPVEHPVYGESSVVEQLLVASDPRVDVAEVGKW